MSTLARCSTRGETRRWRPRSGSSPARTGSPPSRPARRPASTRRSSSATAAATGSARGSRRAVAHVDGEIADALIGLDAADQRAVDRTLDRPRRHADKGAPRRERDPRRLAGRGEGCGGRRRRAALPLGRRRERPRPARAAPERHQRWRPRAELARLPGVHARARRRGEFLGGAPDRRRVVPAPEAAPRRTRTVDGGRGRGRVRARLRLRLRGVRGDPRGCRARRTPRQGRSRARPGHERAVSTKARTGSSAREARSTRPG